jgi:hypothetical protein
MRSAIGIRGVAGVVSVALATVSAVAQNRAHVAENAAGNIASTAQASAEPRSLQIASGTKISAELLTTLDARHARPGQRVIARVTEDVRQDGRTVLRRGSRLIGHVVRAQASGDASAGSSLEVAFDRVVTGKTAASLNAVMTSIVSVPRQTPAESLSEPEPMPAAAPAPGPAASGGRPAGGLVGGAVGAVGATVDSTLNTAGGLAQSGGAVTGAAGTSATLNAASRLAGIEVRPSVEASAGARNSTVLSTRRGNLHLDSGTRIELQVVGQASATRQPSQNP